MPADVQCMISQYKHHYQMHKYKEAYQQNMHFFIQKFKNLYDEANVTHSFMNLRQNVTFKLK